MPAREHPQILLLLLLQDPRNIIIGIQIRAGDWVFRTDRWLLPEDWG